MAKARELKGRIRSVQNTRKITRTMEMVATSKLKRAQDRVAAARPYAEQLQAMIQNLLDPQLAARYPLLRQPEEEERVAILLLTANRGLAGAFNANLIREARELIARLRGEGKQVELHILGKKGISFFRFQGEQIAGTRTDIGDRPSPEEAQSLVDPLMDRFVEGELDAVYVVYAQFKSALSTPPATQRLLPIDPLSAAEGDIDPADTRAAADSDASDFILEPSADAILGKLLPMYVQNSIYRMLVETVAAEQGARRTAMKNATDSAGDIIESLTRTYNRARQAQITQEIAEIVGGAAALE